MPKDIWLNDPEKLNAAVLRDIKHMKHWYDQEEARAADEIERLCSEIERLRLILAVTGVDPDAKPPRPDRD